MEENGGKSTNYRIECIEDEPKAKTAGAAEPERLETDPLDNLPDLSSQTGGLPIVTFILFCLSACSVFLINRMITAHSMLISVGCALIIMILPFRIVARIRGMFRKLHNQKEDIKWYGISATVMTAGIIIGAIVGILCWF